MRRREDVPVTLKAGTLMLEIEDLAAIRLEPGDALFVRTRVPVSQETADRLREQFRSRLPGVPVLVAHDLDVSVIRPAAGSS